MTDRTELERALTRVCEAAREHLAAVTATGGRRADDDAVWAAYTALATASLAYDRLLEERTGELTPWDVAEPPDEHEVGGDGPDHDGPDAVEDDLRLSVRQRRDYVVPSIEGLLAAGTAARAAVWAGAEREQDRAHGREPVRSVGEAVYELLHAGGGSLAGLDVPALVPQSGLVLVNVVDDTLGPDDLDAPPHEADELFELPDAPLVFSLYEPVYGSLEEAERDLEGRDREVTGE